MTGEKRDKPSIDRDNLKQHGIEFNETFHSTLVPSSEVNTPQHVEALRQTLLDFTNSIPKTPLHGTPEDLDNPDILHKRWATLQSWEKWVDYLECECEHFTKRPPPTPKQQPPAEKWSGKPPDNAWWSPSQPTVLQEQQSKGQGEAIHEAMAVAMKPHKHRLDSEESLTHYLRRHLFHTFQEALPSATPHHELFDQWCLEKDVLWNESDHIRWYNADPMIRERTGPKPDLTYAFPIFSEIQLPLGFADQDCAQNFQLEFLANLRGNDILRAAPTTGLQRWSENHDTKALRSHDLMCFPFAVVEIKHADPGPSKVAFCYCQAANASADALSMIESMFQRATGSTPADLPPIIAYTCIGPELRVWLTYRVSSPQSPSTSKKQTMMTCIWATTLELTWGVYATRLILNNMHRWASRVLRPRISECLSIVRNKQMASPCGLSSSSAPGATRASLGLSPSPDNTYGAGLSAPALHLPNRTRSKSSTGIANTSVSAPGSGSPDRTRPRSSAGLVSTGAPSLVSALTPQISSGSSKCPAPSSTAAPTPLYHNTTLPGSSPAAVSGGSSATSPHSVNVTLSNHLTSPSHFGRTAPDLPSPNGTRSLSSVGITPHGSVPILASVLPDRTRPRSSVNRVASAPPLAPASLEQELPRSLSGPLSPDTTAAASASPSVKLPGSSAETASTKRTATSPPSPNATPQESCINAIPTSTTTASPPSLNRKVLEPVSRRVRYGTSTPGSSSPPGSRSSLRPAKAPFWKKDPVTPPSMPGMPQTEPKKLPSQLDPFTTPSPKAPSRSLSGPGRADQNRESRVTPEDSYDQILKSIDFFEPKWFHTIGPNPSPHGTGKSGPSTSKIEQPLGISTPTPFSWESGSSDPTLKCSEKEIFTSRICGSTTKPASPQPIVGSEGTQSKTHPECTPSAAEPVRHTPSQQSRSSSSESESSEESEFLFHFYGHGERLPELLKRDWDALSDGGNYSSGLSSDNEDDYSDDDDADDDNDEDGEYRSDPNEELDDERSVDDEGSVDDEESVSDEEPVDDKHPLGGSPALGVEDSSDREEPSHDRASSEGDESAPSPAPEDLGGASEDPEAKRLETDGSSEHDFHVQELTPEDVSELMDAALYHAHGSQVTSLPAFADLLEMYTDRGLYRICKHLWFYCQVKGGGLSLHDFNDIFRDEHLDPANRFLASSSSWPAYLNLGCLLRDEYKTVCTRLLKTLDAPWCAEAMKWNEFHYRTEQWRSLAEQTLQMLIEDQEDLPSLPPRAWEEDPEKYGTWVPQVGLCTNGKGGF